MKECWVKNIRVYVLCERIENKWNQFEPKQAPKYKFNHNNQLETIIQTML